MSNELHLTYEQLAELANMGSLAQQAAYELGLWRWIKDWDNDNEWRLQSHKAEGLAGPVTVLYSKHATRMCESIVIGRSDPMPQVEIMRTIQYAFNTAELRAALVYWTLEYGRMTRDLAEYGDQASEMVGTTIEDWDTANDMVEAIAAALKGVRLE